MKREAKHPKVAILLSVFNGEKWISELLESIAHQVDVEVDLIWRDDNSTDASSNIVSNFPQINKIQCTDINNNIGPAQSFIHLLSHANDYDYVAFCDQDDVWYPDKLSAALNFLMRTPDIPSVYASKVRIMDQNMSWPIVRYEITLANAVFQNVFMGCTIVINNSACRILNNSRFPQGLMHDSWIYCIGAHSMQLYFDQNPHMAYRLHQNNDTGIKATSPLLSKSSLIRLSTIFKVRNEIKVKLLELTLLNRGLSSDSNEVQLLLCLRNPSILFRVSKIRSMRFRQNNFENVVFKLLWAIKFF